MHFGQSIRIYLADGTVTGLRHAEVVNWTGQALACPRSRVAELSEWDEARRPGIYFLFGYDDQVGRPLAYIGEAENVLTRLQNQLANKENWNEVIIFTNKDENLTKSHVKYLESKLVSLARSAKRYSIENGNEPQPASLPRGDRDAMDSFLEQIRMLIGVLGHRVLEPVSGQLSRGGLELPKAPRSGTTGLELHFKSRGVDARARQTDEGVVVLAGSKGRSALQDTLSPGYAALKRKLIEAGTMTVDGDSAELLEDFLFASPSAAAAILVGRPMNGRTAWKTGGGRTLAELEEVASRAPL